MVTSTQGGKHHYNSDPPYDFSAIVVSAYFQEYLFKKKLIMHIPGKDGDTAMALKSFNGSK
jgi:hypothetical protein